jgi:acetyl esterase/lipase
MPYLRVSAVTLLLVYWIAFSGLAWGQEVPNAQREVIYGHKNGMALSMGVFSASARPSGKGIIYVVSGGFYSAWEWLPQVRTQVNPLLDRGYTVFAVLHGSTPRYTVPDVISYVHRAVRFVRYYAGEYGVNPAQLGIYSGSAGGHLALMIATADEKVNHFKFWQTGW